MNEINNSICRINNKKDIGLFCNIKVNHKNIPVIIINNYINNEKYSNRINIILNNKEQIIDIDKIIYRDKKYNISIIKVKNNSNINIKYIEIDDKVYEKESEIYYNNESIYIIQRKSENVLVSYGLIKEIYKNEIIYKGNINSDYSLIFNLNNNKLIGIHKNKTKYYNKGICFNNIKIRIKNYNNYNNEIRILINIKKQDINKKIYFIDNNNNDLKKLNENNTELLLNDRLEIYNSFIISEKIGINEIKFKFNYDLNNIEYMFAEVKILLK